MAEGSSFPPALSLQRSAQSGSKAMTAAWQVVYTDNTASSALAYFFGGAEINLSPMQAGDVINTRIRKVVVPGGNWVVHDQVSYAGVQPATHQSVRLSGMPDIHGIEIAMQQTAGVLRTIETEFYMAKRVGLS